MTILPLKLTVTYFMLKLLQSVIVSLINQFSYYRIVRFKFLS